MSSDPLAHAPIDAHLDEVLVRQMLFKTYKMKAIVLAILHHAVAHGVFWPDEIVFDFLSEEDCNCIGSIFRLLGPKHWKEGDSGRKHGPGLEMIEKTGNFRRSTKKGRRGSTIFQYALRGNGVMLAKSFVRKYDLAKAKADVTPRLPGFDNF